MGTFGVAGLTRTPGGLPKQTEEESAEVGHGRAQVTGVVMECWTHKRWGHSNVVRIGKGKCWTHMVVKAREHGGGGEGGGLGSRVVMEGWTHRRWGQAMVVGPQRSAWA